MRIRKRLSRAQNLIEFVVVIPILILILFGIIELALFWKTINNVQEIALEAAAGAAAQYVPDDAASNAGADKAINIVQNRVKSLEIEKITFTEQATDPMYGTKPFTLYEYDSVSKATLADGSQVPLIKLIVDYRDPYKNGVITQLIYQYRTVLLGMEFSMPGGSKVVIIPRDIEVSSTKIQQYKNY